MKNIAQYLFCLEIEPLVSAVRRVCRVNPPNSILRNKNGFQADG